MIKKTLSLLVLIPVLFIAGCAQATIPEPTGIPTTSPSSTTDPTSSPTDTPAKPVGPFVPTEEQEQAWQETMFDLDGGLTVDAQREMALDFCNTLPNMTVTEFKELRRPSNYENAAMAGWIQTKGLEIFCPEVQEHYYDMEAQLAQTFIGEAGFTELLDYYQKAELINSTIGMDTAKQIANEVCAIQKEQSSEGLMNWLNAEYANTSNSEEVRSARVTAAEFGTMAMCNPMLG